MGDKISIVLPKELREEVERLVHLTHEDRSTVVRRLMVRGLREVKLDLAIDLYVKGRASIERAAKMSGLSIWRFIDELRGRRIASRYTIEDAEEEIRRIAKTFLDTARTG